MLRDSNARNNLYSRGAANTFAGAKPNIAADVPAIPPAQILKNFLLDKTFPKLDCTFQFDLNLLDSCLIDLQKNQLLGCKTGATHACAFFDLYGSMLAIYEDVGRHVALDKLLGWHAKSGKPRGFILASSRASYEMVQKTVACGVEMLVTISAATDLAVTMAEKHNLTLIGFAREGKGNIYSGHLRLHN